ncbi:putative polysaccharide biosynthesis protein [Lysinibacillus sp. LZ02]|uniref:putative polysaccharide biosynthesis protein n=1 Tax=Lysinibacillus sp. LZ02 TaxID=3420668 RepID=UPI003D366CAF
MASFVKGTLLLTVVIFLSKLFGFVYRMQFMRIAGEEVVGIYMTAYPAFIFFISLVQLGLPIALTKVVAELYAKGKITDTKSVLKTCLRISTVSILVFLPILAFITPTIAETLLQSEGTRYPLIVAIYTVPIVVYAGIIRAYLLGLGKTTPTAWSSLIEQTIRIAAVSFALPYLLTDSSTTNAAFAMGMTALGECAALIYLLIHYHFVKIRTDKKVGTYRSGPLFRIALPSAGSKLFGTFTWFLEPIVFLKALTISGLTATAATTLYGVISGVHIPLLLFPAFIPAALAIILIPAISNAAAVQNVRLLNQRITISLRLCSLIGCYAATFFLLYGDFLAVELFHLNDETNYMKILAPIFYFYYIQSPLLSILQALDQARVAMMNSIYGGIGKLLLMLVLAAQPMLQQYGAIIAIGFGVLLTSFLHIASVRNNPKIEVGFRLFAASYGCFIVTCIVQSTIPYNSIITSIVTTFSLLTILLLLTKQINLSDFRYVRLLFSRL